MSRRTRALLAAFLISCGSAAIAQDGGAGSESAGAPLDRAAAILTPQLQISAGTEEDSASIGLELPAGPSQATRFGLVVSTPLNGEDDAQPATLDGLANGTKATLKLSRFDLTVAEPDARALQIAEDARLNCEIKRRAEGASDADVAKCRTEPVGNIIARYNEARVREFNAHMIPRDAAHYGIEGSIGVKDFDYVDPATLEELDDRKVQWSVKGFYSRYLRRSKTSFTVGVGYERAYEGADEEIFCPINGEGPVATCVTAAGAPPELNKSLLLSAGLRHQFMRGGILTNIAVAPLVTYDALDDVVGVDLPIYFIPNSDSGLSGGVRLGYRSDRDDKFSIGIFIGAAFDILK